MLENTEQNGKKKRERTTKNGGVHTLLCANTIATICQGGKVRGGKKCVAMGWSGVVTKNILFSVAIKQRRSRWRFCKWGENDVCVLISM